MRFGYLESNPNLPIYQERIVLKIKLCKVIFVTIYKSVRYKLWISNNFILKSKNLLKMDLPNFEIGFWFGFHFKQELYH